MVDHASSPYEALSYTCTLLPEILEELKFFAEHLVKWGH